MTKTAKNLTDAYLKSLQKPSKRTDIKDARMSGLSIRVYPTGAKTFRQRYMVSGRAKVITLGHYPAMSLAKAREAAQANHDVIVAGLDPVTEKQSMPTVQKFSETYLNKYAKIYNKDWKKSEQILNADVLPFIGSAKLDKIKRRDLVAVIDRIRDRGAYTHANRVLAVVRKMFNLAVERDVIEVSPAQGIKQTEKKARDVVLDDEAIRILWTATEANSDPLPLHYLTRNVLRLLLLTGARNAEVGGIRVDEIDTQKRIWTLPAERSKNGLTHTVPLSDMPLQIIDKALETSEKGFLFPTVSRTGETRSIDNTIVAKAMARIFHGGYTPHDLRRTAATRLSALGNNRLIVDKIMNHKDNSIGGVYDRHSYDEEKRSALSIWAAELGSIIN